LSNETLSGIHAIQQWRRNEYKDQLRLEVMAEFDGNCMIAISEEAMTSSFVHFNRFSVNSSAHRFDRLSIEMKSKKAVLMEARKFARFSGLSIRSKQKPPRLFPALLA
jgi:hypothetical protein